MKFAFYVCCRCRRNANLIKLRIHLNVLASAGSKRGYNGKDRLTCLHALAVTAIAKHTGASYLAVKCVGVNWNMQIRAKSIRGSATISHRIVLTDLHLNSTANECHSTCFGNLTALHSLGSVAICITIVCLIRRRQIYFLSHSSFLLIIHEFLIVFCEPHLKLHCDS